MGRVRWPPCNGAPQGPPREPLRGRAPGRPALRPTRRRVLRGSPLARANATSAVPVCHKRSRRALGLFDRRSDLDTSTSSSASIHSIAVSIVSTRGGASRTFSSLPWLRTFDSFFSLMTLTSVSFGRLCSPTIMPSYTSTPGVRKNDPRGCRWCSAYGCRHPAAVGDDRAGGASSSGRPRAPSLRTPS
jgi:hypothetical protein